MVDAAFQVSQDVEIIIPVKNKYSRGGSNPSCPFKMKKMKQDSFLANLIFISLMFGIPLAMLNSCSSEEVAKECDCNITIATYNEAMQAYEPIRETHYSDNCSDYSPHYNPVGDGTYYSIDCRSE